MPQRLILSLAYAVGVWHGVHAVEGTLKIPVEVDRAGKQIYFVTDSDSNVALEAARFCAAHFKKRVDLEECASKLEDQVDTIRKLRREAQNNLPGISFTVANRLGKSLKFVHEEGANPGDEARAFCAEHFAEVPESECVDAMLQNAKKALDEATSRT